MRISNTCCRSVSDKRRCDRRGCVLPFSADRLRLAGVAIVAEGHAPVFRDLFGDGIAVAGRAGQERNGVSLFRKPLRQGRAQSRPDADDTGHFAAVRHIDILRCPGGRVALFESSAVWTKALRCAHNDGMNGTLLVGTEDV